MKRLLILSIAALCVVSCGRREQRAVQTGPAVFQSVPVPQNLHGEALADYMRAHYWDRFDFADTLFLSQADTLHMLDAYATFISYVNPSDPSPVDTLMRKASVSRPMLMYFWMLGRKVLYDPNSALRSDELYIPVLNSVVDSPWLGEWERIGPGRELRLACQNRPGKRANDFRYILASGDEGTLYGLDADYTLLLISNPECPMCRELRIEIGASPRLGEMIERGELNVLAIYPDEDLGTWRKHLKEIPASWINAYDKGCVIREKNLYDTKAIPSMYLLDRDKRVLLKDSVSVPDVEAVLDAQS